MRLRGIRLLVHRGQVLLLLVVGVLAGVAVAGVCLELCGVSVLGTLRVNELFVQPRSSLPSQIVIGGAPATDSGLAGSAAANPVPTVAHRSSPDPIQPTATTSVVPGPVYTYPPDDDGRGGPGPGGGHGGRGE